jgi:endonuclease/exonuclease/phosphatase family metal-dependent hydrolase
LKRSGAGRDNRFVITGDFNATPESLAIARMKDSDLAVDSYMISETPPAGPAYTFNGWKDEPLKGGLITSLSARV